MNPDPPGYGLDCTGIHYINKSEFKLYKTKNVKVLIFVGRYIVMLGTSVRHVKLIKLIMRLYNNIIDYSEIDKYVINTCIIFIQVIIHVYTASGPSPK